MYVIYHFYRIIGCARELAALGCPVPEADLCLQLLSVLPREYTNFHDLWLVQSQATGSWSWTQLEAALRMSTVQSAPRLAPRLPQSLGVRRHRPQEGRLPQQGHQ